MNDDLETTRTVTTYEIGPHGAGWRVVRTYIGDRLISVAKFYYKRASS